MDYDFGNGVHIHSQCRQIAGCYRRVGEYFRGSSGEVYPGGKLAGKEVSIPTKSPYYSLRHPDPLEWA